ncbi:MAG: ABC transporter substrate-binding protein [Rhodobacteraceae bacterium]|nr:ABC transporter substrate-binding protein [Paracoccaceae bacterium]
MLRLFIICLALMVYSPGAKAQSYPVTIEHQFGTTEITAPAKRVVSLSYIAHDTLLALGVVPYALRRWYGSDPYGVWIWGHDALGDAQPIVMQGEINIEQVAAMQPDLIVGQWSGMTQRDYNLLSRIAPTIAARAEYGDVGIPWQQMTRTLGLVTGTSARAEEIIARIEARLTSIRNAHPEWQGATSVMVWIGQNGAYTSLDNRGRFLTDLGFMVPDLVDEKSAFDNFYVLIPAEDLSPIDVDALIWIDPGGMAQILDSKPLRPTMRSYREGREIYADQLLSAALSHSSPLSIDYALDRIVPLLEAAMDGDPTSQVPSSRDAGILPDGY